MGSNVSYTATVQVTFSFPVREHLHHPQLSHSDSSSYTWQIQPLSSPNPTWPTQNLCSFPNTSHPSTKLSSDTQEILGGLSFFKPSLCLLHGSLMRNKPSSAYLLMLSLLGTALNSAQSYALPFLTSVSFPRAHGRGTEQRTPRLYRNGPLCVPVPSSRASLRLPSSWAAWLVDLFLPHSPTHPSAAKTCYSFHVS